MHSIFETWFSRVLANSVLSKGQSAIPTLFNDPELLILDDSDISLPVFCSRTNLKLHNISLNPKMVKKSITNLDLSKTSGPNCIPVVVPKNCESELSYILAKLFNKCLKESLFFRLLEDFICGPCI